MTEKEINRLVNKNIKIPSTTEKECDLTGRIIERMEPHFVLFEEINASFRGFKKDFLSDKCLSNLSIRNNIKIREPRPLIKCDFCQCVELDNIEIYKNLSSQDDRNIVTLCSECLDSFIKNCRFEMGDVREIIHHVSSSGFVIAEFNEDKGFNDYLTGNHVESENVVKIGCSDVGETILTTDISNFGDLVEIFDEPEEHRRSKREHIVSCDTCGRFSEKGCKIETDKYTTTSPQYCINCTNNIYTELKKFLEKNEDFVISRTI